MYKALALDLDGTLTNSRKEITEKTRETLFSAMDRGVKVILASGRPLMGITYPAHMLEMERRGGIIMAFNGGVIVDCISGNVLRRVTVPPECIPDIYAAAQAAACIPITYTEDEIVTETIDEYVLKEKICVNADIMTVESMLDFVDYPTPKFLIVGPHEKLIVAEKMLKDKHSDKLNIFYSESYFLEVCPKGVSKDTGLAAVCEHLGLSSAELMACGDGMNDMPMLGFAGLSVAMANSCKAVLDMADYVTLSNDDDGVADAVEKFILTDENKNR
ncbi:MAG: HAD family phosphatase [Oscillospiraceae bacterium]|nr:HAD family phosphatase [Oscillospiraceae bacterium]